MVDIDKLINEPSEEVISLYTSEHLPSPQMPNFKHRISHTVNIASEKCEIRRDTTPTIIYSQC